MKRSLLIAMGIFALLTAPTMAAVTIEESTDAEYLINSGYSQLTAEDIFMQKNRVNGKPVEPLYEKSQNKFVKCFRAFRAYLDPALDAEDRLHHDIQPSPAHTDL